MENPVVLSVAQTCLPRRVEPELRCENELAKVGEESGGGRTLWLSWKSPRPWKSQPALCCDLIKLSNCGRKLPFI